MFLLNGQPLSPDSPFSTPDGTCYPANWIRLSTPEERAAIGITEVPDPRFYDQRFYWGYDAEDNLIPKDHTQLVEQWTGQTAATANTLLSPSDWQLVRQVDNGTPADTNLKNWRQDIRLSCNEKITKIKATTSTDELATYVTGGEYFIWPQLNPPQSENLLDGSSSDTVIFNGITSVTGIVNNTLIGSSDSAVDSVVFN